MRPARLPSRALPRVLIVDDSAVARAVLAQLVEASGRFAVAAALSGAAAAVAFVRAHPVDIVLLDIAMPGVDGLAALPELILASAGAKVVIVSAGVRDDGAAAAQAIALGAAATLAKPARVGEDSSLFRTALLARLDRLVDGKAPALAAVDPARAVTPPAAAASAFGIVAIGASTGGIHALGQLLRAIPAGFDTPILVTQHLPAAFMPYFAAQLAVIAGRPAEVASDRLRIRPGQVVVAPGDAHIRCVALGEGSAAIRLATDPQPSGCTPSVDPMLASVAEVYGAAALGIVLSGMGRDGAEGARALHDAGGCLLAQDRDTSVVWGMPGAVAGFADAVLPPGAIGALAASGRRP